MDDLKRQIFQRFQRLGESRVDSVSTLTSTHDKHGLSLRLQ
jgi:hypothetical protein